MAHSNVYLFRSKDELSIIDTGTPGNAKKIISFIQEIGLKSSDVTAIVLTHFHIDHVGSAQELKNLLPNAKVAVHEADAEYVAGKKPLPRPKNILFRAVSAFIKFSPVQIDVPLKDREQIGQLTVIHTPGHTPGSIALMDETNKVLFSGDNLRYDGNKLTGPPEAFSLDRKEAWESVGKLAALDYGVMLPGHGEVLRNNASSTVKKFWESSK